MKQLKKKAVTHPQELVSTKVTYGQAWVNHIMCFIPSDRYPLLVCHLSEFQLNLLQLAYLMVFKSKLGFH